MVAAGASLRPKLELSLDSQTLLTSPLTAPRHGLNWSWKPQRLRKTKNPENLFDSAAQRAAEEVVTESLTGDGLVREVERLSPWEVAGVHGLLEDHWVRCELYGWKWWQRQEGC